MKANDGARPTARRGVVSYANVVSTLALFVALGGGAWAALTLPAHSVGARELAHGAVTADKLHRGGVTAAAVRSGSLTGGLFRRGSITAEVLAAGPRGRVQSRSGADQPGPLCRGVLSEPGAVDDQGPEQLPAGVCRRRRRAAARRPQLAGERNQKLVVSTAAVHPQAPRDSAESCASWLDTQTQVFVCDPIALKRTAASFGYDQPGTVAISAPGVSRSESFPGLCMTLGGELTPGETATITGRSGPGTQVQVDYVIGTIKYVGELTTGAFAASATATVRVDSTGATLADAGGHIQRFVTKTAFDLARPAPPNLVLRRQGRTNRGRVTLTSQTPTVRLLFLDGRGRQVGPLRTLTSRLTRERRWD